MGLALLASPSAGDLRAETITATVLSIGDGDTLRVKQGTRSITVRLACIDAPEMAQAPYGTKARQYLQLRLRPGRTVRLDVKTTDRYGRKVAEVISDINIGLALVEDGQASSTASTSPSATRRNIWPPRFGPAAVGMASGMSPAASPAPGTSGEEEDHQGRLLPAMAPPPMVAAFAVLRSAHGRGASNCCGRGASTSMGMAMARSENLSVAEKGQHSPINPWLVKILAVSHESCYSQSRNILT